jgi:hypothetical protein
MRHRTFRAAIVAASVLVSIAGAVRADDAPPASPGSTSGPASPGSAAGPASPAPVPPPVMPDEALLKAIDTLRNTAIGKEPNSVAYLDRIATGRASAPQVNDFAAYLAKRGMPKAALAFQEYAVRMQPADATLWLNLGTIRRTNRSNGPAVTAYKKAIELDPGNALAHYNLGAVYDAEKHYDDAIEEYRRALVLDPELADPRKNPQVVNNDNLLAVRLELYRNQAGSLGLPLLQMQKPTPTPPPAPTPAPTPAPPPAKR